MGQYDTALKFFEKATIRPDAEEAVAKDYIAAESSTTLEKNTIESLEIGIRYLNYARTFIKKAEKLVEKQKVKNTVGIRKEIEAMYKSATQNLTRASKYSVQSEIGKEIEILLSMSTLIYGNSLEERKEALNNFQGLVKWVKNSPDVKAKTRRGEFDVLSEICEQTYHYYKAAFWKEIYDQLNKGGQSERGKTVYDRISSLGYLGSKFMK